jgi:hypothetical protein
LLAVYFIRVVERDVDLCEITGVILNARNGRGDCEAEQP